MLRRTINKMRLQQVSTPFYRWIDFVQGKHRNSEVDTDDVNKVSVSRASPSCPLSLSALVPHVPPPPPDSAIYVWLSQYNLIVVEAE